MNECINIYELIQKELDGELSAEEVAILNEHCQFCSTCQELRAEFNQTVNLVTQLPLLDPDEDFLSNVLNAIEEETIHNERKDFNLAGFQGLIAGIALILTSVVFLLSGLGLILLLGFAAWSYNKNLINNFLEPIYYWLTYLYDLLGNILQAFGYIFTPTIIGLTLIISLISFVLLIFMIHSRRTVGYEN